MTVANIAYVYDFALLLLFSFTAVRAWQRGFLATLANLAGKVLGIAGAAWASRHIAPVLYADYLGSAIGARAEQALAESGGNLAETLNRLTFLPETLRATLAQTLVEGTETLPQQLVAAMEPVLLPLLQLLVAIIACLALALAFRLVVELLRHVNGVPLLGGVNRFVGLLFGLLTGLINCWLVVLLLWFLAAITAGQVDFLSTGVLGQSIGYRFFSAFNPFLTHY